MTLDISAHIATMTRTVKSTMRDGRPAKVVVASRVYPTDAADLWDALTTPDRLRRWFLPVSGELRLGGRYQFEGNAGGTITRCEPERSVEATWEFGGAVTWVRVTLAAEADGTRLQLEHTAPVEEHWQQFGPGAVGVGWDLGFLGLARHLEDPAAPRPPEADAAWATSAAAKDIYRASSAAWGRAAVDDGAPEAEALAQAELTRAFYSGETPPQDM